MLALRGCEYQAEFMRWLIGRVDYYHPSLEIWVGLIEVSILLVPPAQLTRHRSSFKRLTGGGLWLCLRTQNKACFKKEKNIKKIKYRSLCWLIKALVWSHSPPKTRGNMSNIRSRLKPHSIRRQQITWTHWTILLELLFLSIFCLNSTSSLLSPVSFLKQIAHQPLGLLPGKLAVAWGVKNVWSLFASVSHGTAFRGATPWCFVKFWPQFLLSDLSPPLSDTQTMLLQLGIRASTSFCYEVRTQQAVCVHILIPF